MYIKHTRHKDNKIKIIVRDNKSRTDILNSLKASTARYNLANRLFHWWDILYVNKGSYFVLYLSWRMGKRLFKGTIYEENDHTFIEGKFVLSTMEICTHAMFWLIAWMAIIYVISSGRTWELIREDYLMVSFFGGFLLIFIFDMWHLFIFRDKKCENKIIEFLERL